MLHEAKSFQSSIEASTVTRPHHPPNLIDSLLSGAQDAILGAESCIEASLYYSSTCKDLFKFKA